MVIGLYWLDSRQLDLSFRVIGFSQRGTGVPNMTEGSYFR